MPRHPSTRGVFSSAEKIGGEKPERVGSTKRILPSAEIIGGDNEKEYCRKIGIFPSAAKIGGLNPPIPHPTFDGCSPTEGFDDCAKTTGQTCHYVRGRPAFSKNYSRPGMRKPPSGFVPVANIKDIPVAPVTAATSRRDPQATPWGGTRRYNRQRPGHRDPQAVAWRGARRQGPHAHTRIPSLQSQRPSRSQQPLQVDPLPSVVEFSPRKAAPKAQEVHFSQQRSVSEISELPKASKRRGRRPSGFIPPASKGGEGERGKGARIDSPPCPREPPHPSQSIHAFVKSSSHPPVQIVRWKWCRSFPPLIPIPSYPA